MHHQFVISSSVACQRLPHSLSQVQEALVRTPGSNEAQAHREAVHTRNRKCDLHFVVIVENSRLDYEQDLGQSKDYNIHESA